MTDCTSTWTTVGSSYGEDDILLSCVGVTELRMGVGPVTLDRLSIAVDRPDPAYAYRIEVHPCDAHGIGPKGGLAGAQTSIVMLAGTAAASSAINVFIPAGHAIRVSLTRLRGPGMMEMPLPFSQVQVRVMGYDGVFLKSGEGEGEGWDDDPLSMGRRAAL